MSSLAVLISLIFTMFLSSLFSATTTNKDLGFACVSVFIASAILLLTGLSELTVGIFYPEAAIIKQLLGI